MVYNVFLITSKYIYSLVQNLLKCFNKLNFNFFLIRKVVEIAQALLGEDMAFDFDMIIAKVILIVAQNFKNIVHFANFYMMKCTH